MSSQADSSRGITNGGKSIRCRIQWLGGKSRFLVPRALGSSQSKVVIAKAKGGNCPEASEWTIHLSRDGAKCAIQPIHKENTYFLGGTHAGEMTLTQLTQVATDAIVEKVAAPGDGARSKTWGDTKHEWTCIIRFPGLGRLTVPVKLEGTGATFSPDTVLLSKNDIWRIHVLSEESHGLEGSNKAKGSEPLAASTQQTPELESHAMFDEGRWCLIVAYDSGSPAYLQAGPHGSLFSSKVQGEEAPTQWVISPSGDSCYTIQFANNSKYITSGSPPRLSRLPERWKITKHASPPSFTLENIQEQWTCSIHPAVQDKMALTLNKAGVKLQNIPSKDRSAIKWRWHILFLNDQLPITEHGIRSNLENEVSNYDLSGDIRRMGELSEETHGVEESNIVEEPEPLATPTQQTPKPKTHATSEGRRCLIVAYDGNSAAILQAGPGDSLMSSKAKEGETHTEWVISPSGDSCYTIQLANNSKYIALVSPPRLSKFPSQWKIEKHSTARSFKVENIEEEWTCNIHPATRGLMALKLNKTKVMLQSFPPEERLKMKWKWHILFLKDQPPATRHSPLNDSRDEQLDMPLKKRLSCRISLTRSSKVFYLAPTNGASVAHGNLDRLDVVSQDPELEWILTPNGNGYTLHHDQGDPNHRIPADAVWHVQKAPLKKLPTETQPDTIEHFMGEIRRKSWGRPALIAMLDKDKQKEGNRVCGMAMQIYSVNAQPWHIEVLKEEIVSDMKLPENHKRNVQTLPLGSQESLTDKELFVTDNEPLKTQQWAGNLSSIGLDDSLSDGIITQCDAPETQPQPEAKTYQGHLDEEENPPMDVRKCRIQHILTGRYIVARTSGIEVAEFAGEDGWILKMAGPGHIFFMPDSASPTLQEQYLAPGVCDNDGNTILCLSEFPATWDLSEKYNRYTECSDVELAEWICKIRWPFTGQYLSSDLAQNNDGKSIPGARFLVWMGRNGARARLNDYWRIQFLL